MSHPRQNPPPMEGPPRSTQELFQRLVYFSHVNQHTQYERPTTRPGNRLSAPTMASAKVVEAAIDCPPHPINKANGVPVGGGVKQIASMDHHEEASLTNGGSEAVWQRAEKVNATVVSVNGNGGGVVKGPSSSSSLASTSTATSNTAVAAVVMPSTNGNGVTVRADKAGYASKKSYPAPQPYTTAPGSNGVEPKGQHHYSQHPPYHPYPYTNGGPSGYHTQPTPALPPVFTAEPSQLCGTRFTTHVQKGSAGLGFTLIGNDGANTHPEFIQIKSILVGGPAAADGRLQTGDVLVYVNGECMLGAMQEDAVSI